MTTSSSSGTADVIAPAAASTTNATETKRPIPPNQATSAWLTAANATPASRRNGSSWATCPAFSSSSTCRTAVRANACTAAMAAPGSNASAASRHEAFIEVKTLDGTARSTTKLVSPPSHSAMAARNVVLAMSAKRDAGRSAVTGVATTSASLVRVLSS